MAQTFKINGTSLTYITQGNWSDSLDDQALDGNAPLLRDRRHVWRADVMSADEFDTLTGLLGEKVSVTTPDYNDRNAADYETYYGCDFDSLDGRHEGPNMAGVVAEFRVRL